MATPFLTSLDERFTLFGERFVPTTNMFTFVRADPQTLIVGNTEWANSLNNYLASWRHEDLSVEEGLASLEPLCGDDYRVELIVPTRNPEWAAVFSNSFAGGSGTSPYWAESNLSADTVMVSLARSVRTGEFGRGQLGGCQFAYNRFVDGGVREHYSVSVINEGSSRPRWRFLHSMAFADFEDRGAYESRRVVDRFTPAMLVEYCAALGLRPFDEDFYADECYRMIEQAKGWESRRPIRRSFHEEQYRRGFTDVKPDSMI